MPLHCKKLDHKWFQERKQNLGCLIGSSALFFMENIMAGMRNQFHPELAHACFFHNKPLLSSGYYIRKRGKGQRAFY